MTRRHLGAAVGLGVMLALTCSSIASAKYRGTDMWDNIMPSGGDGLIGRYPISHYQLDYHVDSPVGFGGISSSNAFAFVGQLAASILWFLGVLFMRVVIVIFQWAFSADLISGPHGGLEQASQASQHYYTDFVAPFMTTAIICLGVWLAYKTIKSRERSDAGQAIVRVVALSVVSLVIVFHPQQTVGAAFSAVNNISSALVSRGGNSQDVANSVFSTFIYKPWAVIEFSGLKVCTGAKRDGDNFPLAATQDNPAKTCHSVLKKDADGHGDYAARFLRYSTSSDERKAEYDALRTGQAPDTAQFAGVVIDRTDAPAVDMMQAEGTVQRVAYVLMMLFCMICGALLLVMLAIASLFSQIAFLALLMVASFTMLAAVFPPAHDRYFKFLRLMRDVLIGKAVFSLMLAIVFSTSAILLTLGGQDGYFIAFGIQALLFGGVFFKRKAILGKMTSSRAAEHYSHHESQTVSAVAGAATGATAALSGGASTFAQTMRQGWSSKSQSSGPLPDSSSPPASAGREYSPPGDPPAITEEAQPQRRSTPSPSAAGASMPDREETEMPTRSFQEDLETARAQPPAQRPRLVAASADPTSDEQRALAPTPLRSFADELESAQLAREKPLPPSEIERLRRR